MRRYAIGAVVAVVAVTTAASAQDNTSTITSGPWMMRKSTGNPTEDKLWFIMDRTLNAVEMDTMRGMLRSMPGGTSYVMMKGIVNAIDNHAKANPSDATSSTSDWLSSNGMSDIQVYDAMHNGLSWDERGVLHNWESTATTTQMMVVAKLVQCGGWANSMWTPASG